MKKPSKHPLQFPVYIPTKGRAEYCITMRYLANIGIPFYAVVEEQEYDDYAAKLGADQILVLPADYKTRYETLDDLGLSKSTGPGPARNFAWDHAISQGHAWHWVMDDNIQGWYRFHKNEKNFIRSPAGLRSCEDFALRFENVGMAGPQYGMFAPRRFTHRKPFVINSRIYSCNLIRNDLPFRWRGRYNEDTILSIDMLEAGWCTLSFMHVLANKMATQVLPGGNTEAFYSYEGTAAKSRMLYEAYPQFVELVDRWGRPHHYIDYKKHWLHWPRLRLHKGLHIADEPNAYGLSLREVPRGYMKHGIVSESQND